MLCFWYVITCYVMFMLRYITCFVFVTLYNMLAFVMLCYTTCNVYVI